MIIFFVFYLVATTFAQVRNASDICTQCTCKDAQTFTLNCTDRNLSSILSSWPSENPTIEAIFTGNNLSILEKVPATNSTLDLVLSRCNIQILTDGLFSAATRIRFLDLSYNLLSSEELTSDKFKGGSGENGPGAISVETLNLAYNRIHSLNKNFFEFLPNLTRLNLEGNDFRVLDVHTQLALGKVPGLTSLNLANNELTELLPAAIEHFTNLIELDLSRNDLDFVPYCLQSVGETLETLIVDKNPIIEMNAETFANLTALMQISANNLTKLHRMEAATFATNSKLTKLSFCNGSLREIDPQAFSSKQTLKELHLTNNDLTSIPVHLIDWSHLDILHLENNPWKCSCDFYTIASALSSEITRNSDGPTCVEPTTGRPLQIFSLDINTCESKTQRNKISYHRFSVPLAMLITTLMLGLFAAIAMAQHRYRSYLQRRTDPFVSQVIYSPLLNSRS